MSAISLAEAKARLSELVDRAAAGEVVEITRRGKLVARITGAAKPRQPVDVAALRKMTSKMTPQKESAGEFIRRLRDTDRY